MNVLLLSLFTLLALSFCLIGVYLLRNVIRMVFSWKPATGSVEAHIRDGDSIDLFYLRVRFVAESGKEFVFRSSMATSDPPGVGRKVRVRYPPDDPSEADVLSPGAWIAPMVFLTLGGGCSAMLAYAWHALLFGK